ncbi:hypothetical protein KFK09_016200 [Dendrobium nobile]|uniref:Class II Histidinyl-tRNA synthetase (HisRS)-like catalytic core domain-containing protein n=1 Tax=Dendrobium nobile TaxID=94219 RepID=A0A8T3AYQ1_DENNO|nr:hypothetical protein KFK09_016200 [Dendrobium nobile]
MIEDRATSFAYKLLSGSATARYIGSCTIKNQRTICLVGAFKWQRHNQVNYLKEFGLSTEEVGQLLAYKPQLVGCSIEERWKPLVKYLYYLGVHRDGMKRILMEKPVIFCVDLERTIAPKVRFLQDIGVRQEDIGSVIARFPPFLTYSLYKKIRPVIFNVSTASTLFIPYMIAKVYRRYNPSKGRYREFYQCNFDVAGQCEVMEADFEVLKVLTEVLDELNIGDYEIKLNHRKLLDVMLEICGVSSEKFRTVCSSIDKLDKQSFEQVKKEWWKRKGWLLRRLRKLAHL